MPQAKKSPRYEHQRLQATKAAAIVFAEKGFHGASTADIASRLGIKQGSLYYYFKSKEEALFEVCMLGMSDYLRRMEAIASSQQSFEARLFASISAHLGSYREKNEALKVYNDERLYLSDEQRVELKALGSRYRQLLQGIFDQGKAEGTLRPDIDSHFAALAAIGLCNSWGDHIVREPGLDIFDTVQKCTELLLHGLSQQHRHETNLNRHSSGS
jgi:AcrR family transcriptional regulator